MSAVAPWLVRCSPHGTSALELLQLALDDGQEPSAKVCDQLARDVLDFKALTLEDPSKKQLGCPRVSCYGVSTQSSQDVEHALAVVAVVLPRSSYVATPGAAPALTKNKKLKQKLLSLDLGVVVVSRGRLTEASLEVEHSPERCLCFTPAREQHHDLMAPEEPGPAQAEWVKRVLEALIAGLRHQEASWYRVLSPTCLDQGRPPQVDFMEQVEAVCEECERLHGPMDGPAPPSWSDAPQLSAAEQRARLCKLREEVAEVVRRRALDRKDPQWLDVPTPKPWPPKAP